MGILKALFRYAFVTAIVIFAGSYAGVIKVDFDLNRANELKDQAISATVDGYNHVHDVVLGQDDTSE